MGTTIFTSSGIEACKLARNPLSLEEYKLTAKKYTIISTLEIDMTTNIGQILSGLEGSIYNSSPLSREFKLE